MDSNTLSDNQKLHAALESSLMLAWEYDFIKDEFHYYNKVLFRMLGVLADEPALKMQTWIEQIHPQDRATFNQHFNNILEHGTDTFDLEYRYAQPEGQWGWIHSRGKVIQRNAQGRPLLAVGSGINITQRKQEEYNLRQSNILLHDTLESADEGMLLISHDGRVLSSNRRFKELWHVPQTIVESGRDDLLLAHVLDQLLDPQAFLQLVQRLYGSEEEARDTLHFKDGRVYARYTRALMLDSGRGRIWCFRDISETFRYEQQLKDAKSNLEMTLRAIPDLMFELDSRGTFINAFAHEESLFVFPREVFIGRLVSEIFTAESAATIMTALKDAGQHGYSQGQIIQFDLAEGRKWFELSTATKSTEGDDQHFIVLSRDITERKRVEDSLKQQLLFASALNKISQSLVEQDDPKIILTNTVEILGKALGSDRTLIYDISFKKQQVIGLAEWLNPRFPDIPSSKATYPISAFIAGATYLWQSRTWFVSHRNAINSILLNDGSGTLLHETMQIQSLLWYPFSFKENEFYALVLNQLHSHKEWTAEEISFLDSASHIVSLGLEKIRLGEERANIEAVLVKNEKRLHLALEAAHMGVWEYDFHTQELYWSPEIRRYFGLGEAASSREYLLRITHPEDVNISEIAMNKAINAHALYFAEYRVLVDDKWFWVEDRGEIQYDTDGVPLKVVGTAQDVTASKLAEQELHRESEKNRVLLRNASDGIHILDQEGNVLEASDSFCAMLGYERNEIIGKNVSLWDSKFSPAELKEVVKRQFESPVRVQFETQHRQKDGTFIDVEVSGYPLELFGIPVLFNSSRDVTQRKQSEAELRASESKLNTILDSVDAFIYLKDTEGRYLFANRSVRDLWQVQMQEIIGFGDEKFFDAATAENIKHNDRLVLDSGKTLRTEESSMIQSTGNTATYLSTKLPLRREDGTIFALCGISTDITERILAEQALRASEEHANNLSTMLRLISDNVPDMIWAKDLNKRFIFANKAMCDELLNAHDTAEPIGKDDLFFAQRERNSHAGDPHWHTFGELCQDSDALTLQLGKTAQYDEFGNVKGKFLFLDVRKAPFVNDSGEVIGVVGSARDVTQQREAQERLRLASLVLENSSEALMISDADNRIMEINPAFTKLTGYELSEVVGGNPSMLQSGRHGKDFYRELWNQLQQSGRWQGEIWNRRKDGVIFAEWLTINTIYHDDGSIFRRVALFSDITEKKKSEELIWAQANFDHLTQLPNRRMFRDRLNQDMKKAHRAGQNLALLFLDLDHFKEINDTLGHDLGDTLLIEAARRISSCVRESDTVARLGGDEFTIILTELDDPSSVERIAQEILHRLELPFHLGNEVAYVSASIGITMYPVDAHDPEDLQKNADQSMYVAKNAGRNRFSYFTSAMQEAAQYRLHLLNDLRLALAAGQFQLFFQPIIELSTGKLRKAEALLRWFHPQRGLISPAEFIPLAEDSGLIHEIGDWVFSESVRNVLQWRAKYVADFQVSVNMSPREIQARIRQAEWQRQLTLSGLPGQAIVVEITEGLLLDTSSHVTSQLLAFRDAGVQVAIDDFGTGYSALSYLKKLDIDYVKIDQSFIRALVTDKSDLALTEAMIVMAHKLGLQVIAEGVETPQQRDLLATMGCDFVQGYLYSRPVPAAEFEYLLIESART